MIWQFVLVLLVSNVQGQDGQRKLRMRAALYESIICSAAARNDVDAQLLWTIAYLESRFRPEAISYKDGKPCAFGLMQLVPATAQRYGIKNPHNPSEAVEAAARYVRDLLKRFNGREDLVLAAYNSGEGTVTAFLYGRRLVLKNGKIINRNMIRTGGIPPYRETRRYVALGMRVYQNIALNNLISVKAESSRFESSGTRGTNVNETDRLSIYSSSADPIRGQRTHLEKKEPSKTQSLYFN